MKTKILSISALALVILLVILFYRGCSRNQSPTESVTKDEVIDIDTVGLEEAVEPIDVELITGDESVADVSQSGSKNKKRYTGPWQIKNDVRKVKDIAIEDIAEEIVVRSIVADEPIDHIWGVSGSSNDFIIGNGSRETFYHIKDGRLVEKLHAVGHGPGEYSVQLLVFSYLPADSLFCGYDQNRGQILFYKTSPFRFDSKFDIKRFAKNKQFEEMIVLGRDHLLLTFKQQKEDIAYVYGKCAVYEYDGHSINKVIDIEQDVSYAHACDMFVRSGNDVLMSVLEEKSMLYRYSNGKKTKVATIDYGDMEMDKTKVDIKGDVGDDNVVRTFVSYKECATGCNFAHLTDSVMTYWICPILDDNYYRYLTIATRDNVQNYKVHIGGLNFDVLPNMVDNGVYTMLIQGDWETIINEDEELSPVGKRIIDALKGNDYDPVILQFKLKL
ncbi:MAG: hypothetical protein IJ911_08595 [Salinivirgaceae bacterium]|nr:hypothetical protein [Salinivirgaceae bacterium]